MRATYVDVGGGSNRYLGPSPSCAVACACRPGPTFQGDCQHPDFSGTRFTAAPSARTTAPRLTGRAAATHPKGYRVRSHGNRPRRLKGPSGLLAKATFMPGRTAQRASRRAERLAWSSHVTGFVGRAPRRAVCGGDLLRQPAAGAQSGRPSGALAQRVQIGCGFTAYESLDPMPVISASISKPMPA
jgi:hypothetical protein